MINKNKLQKNRKSILKRSPEYSKGFTLVEAMVAIMILSISVAAMLEVTATTANSARYANNEITASYLLQEAIDSVRNSRDTIVFQNHSSWITFTGKYSSCFLTNGCYISTESFDPLSPSVKSCSNSECVQNNGESSAFKYNSSGSPLFYTYSSTSTTAGNFKRKIKMTDIDGSQIKVTATVEWKNGNASKSQSLETYLLNWYN